MINILIILLLLYTIFLFNYKIWVNDKLKLEYNGLLWVILDAYTIIRYHSSAQIMPWIRVYK